MSKVTYVKQKIIKSINTISGHKDSEVNSKWVDYVFALVFTDFQRKINGNKNFKQQNFLSSENISLDLQTQLVRISMEFYFKKFIEYLIYLLELFLAMMKPSLKIDFKHVSVFYGVNWNQIKNKDFSLDNFHEFIKTYFFETKKLTESKVILVIGREFPRLKPHKDFIPNKYASIALVRYLSLAGKKRLFCLCLRTLAGQMRYSFKDKKYTLMNLPLLDQIILDKSCHELNIKINLVCTQSVLLSPPLGFYYDKNYVSSKIGFWYSDNNLAIPHDSQSAEDFSYDFFRVDLLDRIFVWSESYATVLKRQTDANIEVTEPILMNGYCDQPSELSAKETNKTISFFGISPLINLADLHFNQLQNSIDDLTAISSLVENDTFPNVSLILKIKRDFDRNNHYQKYFNTITNISKLRNVEIITGEEKAIHVIRMSSLVICTPFTSAALIAKYLGVNTVFFTSKDHYKLPMHYEGIKVLVGINSLYEYLEQNYS
jgi:polysaccharide biosynthesis PFTS motif protein